MHHVVWQTFTSETFVNFYQTTWCIILEDSHFQTYSSLMNMKNIHVLWLEFTLRHKWTTGISWLVTFHLFSLSRWHQNQFLRLSTCTSLIFVFMPTKDFQGSTCQSLSMNELTPCFCSCVGSVLTYTLWYCSQVEPNTAQCYKQNCCLITLLLPCLQY
jgi:hypothetical protein